MLDINLSIFSSEFRSQPNPFASQIQSSPYQATIREIYKQFPGEPAAEASKRINL